MTVTELSRLSVEEIEAYILSCGVTCTKDLLKHSNYLVRNCESVAMVLGLDNYNEHDIYVFEHDRTLYFRDSVKNKLYTYESPTDVGAYIGRWCPHSLSVITDVPDSDLED